jgi:hypothetical protein
MRCLSLPCLRMRCSIFLLLTVMHSLLNIVKSFQNLTSTVLCSGKKIGWSIRIILECFQHVFKMYAWSLSESWASIQLKCKLTTLFSKQSFFRKHDFAVYEYNLYHSSQNLHLKIFSCDNKIPTCMTPEAQHNWWPWQSHDRSKRIFWIGTCI